MGRGGTKASALIWGPSAPRRFSARDDLSLDALKRRHRAEATHFESLLSRLAAPGQAERELLGLCRELRGRSVLVPTGASAKQITGPGEFRTQSFADHAVGRVVSATPAKTMSFGLAPKPAEVIVDTDDGRYKVEFRDVAVIYPRHGVTVRPAA